MDTEKIATTFRIDTSPEAERKERIERTLKNRYALIDRAGLIASATLLGIERNYIDDQLELGAFIDQWTTERERIRRATAASFVRQSQAFEGFVPTPEFMEAEQAYLDMAADDAEFTELVMALAWRG